MEASESKFIHAVPNFSEGRRTEVIEAIVGELRDIEGVKLIDYYPDPDFNRTVVEVIGKPETLKEALINMAGKASELINLQEQRGSHPRIGAQDTIPIFPLANISLEECIAIAEEIGEEIFKRYQVPIYFSGENARNEERKSLDFIRKGQFEGLKEVAHLPERAPDVGPAALHDTAGATIVSSAMTGLVAVNVVLGTSDLNIAKSIARAVRGPSGGFSTIRSIGLYFEQRGQVAVSMNMFDTNKTPIYRVFQLIEAEANRYGVQIVGTQIIGTLPQEALVSCAEHFLKLENFNRDQIIENHLVGL
ncbi:MAG: glutamate formimidoyltransferase [Syntrophomonadaceae bacterium]|jgi:glutamate formiminotransferase|nr:glutamate formimidoyltransferase [Bacillota bacterium]NLP23024.1 glutamate formimidoyltransferase [Syntrophomonadaceae bacterium]